MLRAQSRSRTKRELRDQAGEETRSTTEGGITVGRLRQWEMEMARRVCRSAQMKTTDRPPLEVVPHETAVTATAMVSVGDPHGALCFRETRARIPTPTLA